MRLKDSNAWKHFSTITRHRHMVMKHCIKAGIPVQGLFHDLSKYTPEEFLSGVRYYQGTRSPNEGEREVFGYSRAWMHHKGRNKHHYEYWVDYSPKTKRPEPVPMPKRYIIEMFCDRVAASKIYNGKNYKDSDSLEYYLKGKNSKEKLIEDKTAKKLEFLLTMLANNGEEATFRYIRKVYNHAK